MAAEKIDVESDAKIALKQENLDASTANAGAKDDVDTSYVFVDNNFQNESDVIEDAVQPHPQNNGGPESEGELEPTADSETENVPEPCDAPESSPSEQAHPTSETSEAEIPQGPADLDPEQPNGMYAAEIAAVSTDENKEEAQINGLVDNVPTSLANGKQAGLIDSVSADPSVSADVESREESQVNGTVDNVPTLLSNGVEDKEVAQDDGLLDNVPTSLPDGVEDKEETQDDGLVDNVPASPPNGMHVALTDSVSTDSAVSIDVDEKEVAQDDGLLDNVSTSLPNGVEDKEVAQDDELVDNVPTSLPNGTHVAPIDSVATDSSVALDMENKEETQNIGTANNERTSLDHLESSFNEIQLVKSQTESEEVPVINIDPVSSETVSEQDDPCESPDIIDPAEENESSEDVRSPHVSNTSFDAVAESYQTMAAVPCQEDKLSISAAPPAEEFIANDAVELECCALTASSLEDDKASEVKVCEDQVSTDATDEFRIETPSNLEDDRASEVGVPEDQVSSDNTDESTTVNGALEDPCCQNSVQTPSSLEDYKASEVEIHASQVSIDDNTDEVTAENRTLDIPCSQNLPSGVQTPSSLDSGKTSEVKVLEDQVSLVDSEVAETSAQSISDEPTSDVVVSKDEDISICQEEIESADNDQKDQISSLPEHAAEGDNLVEEIERKPLPYIVKIPRSDDEGLTEQIKLAEENVDQLTKNRDDVRAKIQEKLLIAKECNENVRVSSTEQRAARAAMEPKRREIDALQSMLNIKKSAKSVEEINDRIRSMEHRIEHETMSLKEEKQLIREIKQLKQQGKQISSQMGTQEEVQSALDHTDIDERLKLLWKEMDVLAAGLQKPRQVTQTHKTEQSKNNEELNELKHQYKVADGNRQKAYEHLQSLKKQRYEKNKHFYGYKDAVKAAERLAASGDKEQLLKLCLDHEERYMELWNRDDDFRNEYVKSNRRSTLRRLKTLDGRALGPNEEPPVIPFTVYNRVAKDNAASKISIPEQERENATAKVEERKKQRAKATKPAIDSKEDERREEDTRANKEAAKKAEEKRKEEEATKKAEEKKKAEDAARKAEEKRKEEAAAKKAEEKRKAEEDAKLKERLKVEEKAKAQEAMERKKRKAEQAQARAAIRAQKEAEEKEKAKEKRAKKKEIKKAKANGTATESLEEQQSSASATPDNRSECGDETVAIPKEKAPAPMSVRHLKSKAKAMAPLPPRFRNRSKRRFQPWMIWASLGLVLLLALCFFASRQFLR